MGGQKFEYDESGGTFFYFLLSFLALLLIPGTYYWWPRKNKQDPEEIEKECQCDDCKRKKIILQSNDPWKPAKQFFTKLLIVLGWLALAFLAYKVSQFDYEMANFDPYEILGVPMGSSQAEIKKSYRKQSLVLHPDKETGNEKAFMKLTKAYQALTDDEARRNWEKYGNPDGPGAMSFGIALPSWIVEKENSVWVLGLYALVFMVAMPTVVGMWWYKSIRYSGDKVLLDTTQLYYFFFHKTPSMALKRVIMVLAASLEFERKHNNEVVERSTDAEEVPHLIKQISNMSEKNRESPLCYLYSIKARALIHAQLNRIAVNPETLGKDQQYIVKKCPYLIQEMVNCVSQLILLAYARRIPRLPSVETIENVMKLCPMVVQALWDFKSPLLQLPHIREEHLKWFNLKKRPIKSLMQLAQLRGPERRQILRHLSDEQYADVTKVLGQMPVIDFKVKCEVIDDENPTVYTAGAIVTVTVTLERRDMSCVFGDDTMPDKPNEPEGEEEEEEKVKKPAWQKQQRKGRKGGGGGAAKKAFKQAPGAKGAAPAPAKGAATVAKKEEPERVKEEDEEAKEAKEERRKKAEGDEDDSGAESDETGGGDASDDDDTSQQDKKESSVEDDDAEWEKFQTRLSKRDKVLEGRNNQSHPVHCPFYPEGKQEFWWVYMSDRKSHTLLTSPCHVTALVRHEELQLKFTAPRWPGVYTFTVCLRCDSYIGFDQSIDIKLDVKEAPEIKEDHPQWAQLDDEEDEGGAGGGGDSDSVSEFTTDEDVEDDD